MIMKYATDAEIMRARRIAQQANRLTCVTCRDRSNCEFVDDPYNTNGDCLAMK